MAVHRDALAVGRRVGVLACTLAALGGCDVPTELPEWDTRWVIPAESTSIAVAQLLPEGISESPAGDAFDMELPSMSISRSLAEMCAACAPLDGLTVPKPPFTVAFSGEAELPPSLLSAQLEAGTLQLRLQHDLSFDPLRPGSTARGYLILTVRSGSTVLARDSVSGNDVAFPAGTSVLRTLPLRMGPIADAIAVEITLHSPAGDAATIDLDDRLRVMVPAPRLRLSELHLRLSERELSTEPIQLELNEIDAAAADRVRSGAVRLEVTNPFEISADLALRITAPTLQIVRPVAIAPGTSEVRIELSADEIRSILGQPSVLVSLTGRASSPDGGTTVEPGLAIGIRARLELTVRSGSGR